MVVGALLAGGRSRRMGGGHKFLRELNGITLFDRVLARLSPQVDTVVVSIASGSAMKIDGMTMVEDIVPDAGPLGGIHAVLSWAERTLGPSTDIVAVPTDTPFIPVDLVARLQAARSGAKAEIAIATSTSGTHPAVGIWPASVHDDLEVWLSDPKNRAVHAFLNDRPIARAWFDDMDAFVNINTLADLAKAEDRIGHIDDEAGAS